MRTKKKAARGKREVAKYKRGKGKKQKGQERRNTNGVTKKYKRTKYKEE